MKKIKWEVEARIALFLIVLVVGTIVVLVLKPEGERPFVTPTPQPIATETVAPEATDTPQMRYLPPLAITPEWTEMPDRAEPLDLTDVQYTVLLVGMDTRPDAHHYYTDVLMLAILKTDGTISLVSIPRNTLVYVPGWMMTGINEVLWEAGSFEGLGDTFEYNFGIRPNAYAAIDLSGFKRLIDNLGGIDVLIRVDYQGKCDVNGQKWCAVEQGTVHMTGEYALWYVRSRTSAFSDIDRNRRQQEVLMAIVDKIAPENWMDVYRDINAFFEFSHCCAFTDLTINEILQLAASKEVKFPIEYTRYPVYMFVTEYISPEGKYFLIPDLEGFRRTLLSATTNIK